MKLIMWKDSTFFFCILYQFLPSKRLRLPLYWDFGTALALWATGFQVLPSSPMERMEGGKHLQQRRWGCWNWWNPVRKQSTCAFFPLKIHILKPKSWWFIFRSVGSNPHAPFFLNGRPHLFHCHSSRGKGRCSQCLVICKRKRSWKSQNMVISTCFYHLLYSVGSLKGPDLLPQAAPKKKALPAIQKHLKSCWVTAEFLLALGS